MKHQLMLLWTAFSCSILSIQLPIMSCGGGDGEKNFLDIFELFCFEMNFELFLFLVDFFNPFLAIFQDLLLRLA